MLSWSFFCSSGQIFSKYCLSPSSQPILSWSDCILVLISSSTRVFGIASSKCFIASPKKPSIACMSSVSSFCWLIRFATFSCNCSCVLTSSLPKNFLMFSGVNSGSVTVLISQIVASTVAAFRPSLCRCIVWGSFFSSYVIVTTSSAFLPIKYSLSIGNSSMSSLPRYSLPVCTS